MYLLNFLLVGSGVWTSLVRRQEPWDAMVGVAFSFWAALACLSALGLRYPLAMLPVIFVQLFYKTFWLLAVYIPMRGAGHSSNLAQGFLVGLALDLIVIPWPYVFSSYVKRHGDRWR